MGRWENSYDSLARWKTKGRVRNEFSLRLRLGIAQIVRSGVGPSMVRGPTGKGYPKARVSYLMVYQNLSSP